MSVASSKTFFPAFLKTLGILWGFILTGLFLDIGAYALDPANLIGFGYIQKAMMAKQSLTASRLERFFENGLVFGAYEGATMGIPIYHKGSNVWVDALGRVVT